MLLLLFTYIDNHQYDDEFEKIYYENKTRMMKITRSILHNEWDAEDALQNAFIAIARNMKTIAGMDAAAIYVYVGMCAQSAARDMLPAKLRRDRVLSLDEQNFPLTEDLEKDFVSKEHYEELVAIIQGLPEVYQEVLTLNCVYEMKPREIAKLLDRNKETVKSQLKRGRALLIQRIKEHEES